MVQLTTMEVEVEPKMEDNGLNHWTGKRKKKSSNQKSMVGVDDGGVQASEKWRWHWRSVMPMNLRVMIGGQNGQIPTFLEFFSKKTLFRK